MLRQDTTSGSTETWTPFLRPHFAGEIWSPLNPVITIDRVILEGEDTATEIYYPTVIPKLRRLATMLGLEPPYVSDPDQEFTALIRLLDSGGVDKVSARTGRVVWFGEDDNGDVIAFHPYAGGSSEVETHPDKILRGLLPTASGLIETDPEYIAERLVELDVMCRNGILPRAWSQVGDA